MAFKGPTNLYLRDISIHSKLFKSDVGPSSDLLQLFITNQCIDIKVDLVKNCKTSIQFKSSRAGHKNEFTSYL